MTEEWQAPDDAPIARVIFGPRGEKLRVWKEIGKGELGFRSEEQDDD